MSLNELPKLQTCAIAFYLFVLPAFCSSESEAIIDSVIAVSNNAYNIICVSENKNAVDITKLCKSNKLTVSLPIQKYSKLYLLANRANIYILADNQVLVYDNTLKKITELPLEDNGNEYEMRPIAPEGTAIAISDNIGLNYLLINETIKIIKDTLPIFGKKMYLNNNTIYIDSLNTKIRCKNMDQLLYGLIVAGKNSVIWTNRIIELSTQRISHLKEIERICTGYFEFNRTYLLTTPNSILIYDKNFELIRKIVGYYPKLLMKDEETALLKLDSERIIKLKANGDIVLEKYVFRNALEMFFVCDEIYGLCRDKDRGVNMLEKANLVLE